MGYFLLVLGLLYAVIALGCYWYALKADVGIERELWSIMQLFAVLTGLLFGAIGGIELERK